MSQTLEPGSLSGRTALVTGSSRGLGEVAGGVGADAAGRARHERGPAAQRAGFEGLGHVFCSWMSVPGDAFRAAVEPINRVVADAV